MYATNTAPDVKINDPRCLDIKLVVQIVQLNGGFGVTIVWAHPDCAEEDGAGSEGEGGGGGGGVEGACVLDDGVGTSLGAPFVIYAY